MSCISIGFIMSNLFIIELMFKWPIIICWWWFERRRFETDLTLPSWIAWIIIYQGFIVWWTNYVVVVMVIT